MNLEAINALIKVHTTVGVHSDFVPEKASLPAVAYTQLSYAGDRVLSGKTAGNWNSWRIMVKAKTRREVQNVINELETLDGVSDVNYQSVMMLYSGIVPALPDDKVYTGMVDIRTYGR